MSEPLVFDPDPQPDSWKYQPRACAHDALLADVAERVLLTMQDAGLSASQALQVVRELPVLITHHARLCLAPSNAAEPGQ